MQTKESMLYEQIENEKVRCNLCARRCLISEGRVGFCRVRKNIKGKLYSLNYAKACSAIIDPIGKKPLSHFHPGSLVMSIATIGCNFRCQFCLDGDNTLPLLIDDRLTFMSVKELNSFFKEEQTITDLSDIEIYAINHRGPVKVLGVSRRKANDRIYEIITECERRINLTGEHIIPIVNENGEIKGKRASEIRSGDRLFTFSEIFYVEESPRANLFKGITLKNLKENLKEKKRRISAVRKVKVVKPTYRYVYDLTLAGGIDWEAHTFYAGDGILVHNCDNWVISQERDITGRYLPPEEVVKLTVRYGAQGISYTYTEPTIFFEYAYDTAVLAHKKGLFNTFVTNGYMTPETVRAIAPCLDAATVGFKGGGDPEFYRRFSAVPSVNPIFEALKEMKRHGIHIEVTNLIVPRVGDSMEKIKELAEWIRDNLGKNTPLHLLRFHPDYKLTQIPATEIKTMEEAYETAKEAGLNYVYLGNVPGHRYENTYCPNCGELLIGRYGFDITRWRITEDMRCPACGEQIPIKGKYYREGFSFSFPIF
ncbi:TPA: radical SAM protein [Candidatus Bathyarchaeota archaeon]|nr:radical SAM protein [Candidatus Bathyarchaeota archaeon]